MKLFSTEAKEQRKSFLTTICILSMIYCTYIFINSIVALFGGPMDPEELEERKQSVIENMQFEGEMDKEQKQMLEETKYAAIKNIEESNEHFYSMTAMNLITGSIGLLGVLMMFNLDKRGFGLYITSCLIWTFGMTMFLEMTVIIQIGILFYGIISLAFIFMYGMNLKHMKMKFFN